MALTLEQMAVRRRGIGASEIAAIVGLNPWASPITVYQNKVCPLAPEQNAAITHGNTFEPTVREAYAFKMQRRVTIPETLVHPKNPLVLATPDGISHGPEGDFYLEIKCPTYQGQFGWGKDGTDEVPDHYIPQVTWGMAVTGLKVAHFAALVFNEVRIYTVQYDHELFLALEKKAMQFWHDHVVPQKPPQVDGSKSFEHWLKQRYCRDNGQVIEAFAGGDRMVRDLMQAKARQKKIDERVRFIENKIKLKMGEAQLLKSVHGKVSWSTNRDTPQVKWEALARDLAQGPPPAQLLAKHTSVRAGSRQFRARFNDDADNGTGA